MYTVPGCRITICQLSGARRGDGVDVTQRIERLNRAYRCSTFLTRSEVREAVKLYMLEPETKTMFQGWVYEVLLRDQEHNNH